VIDLNFVLNPVFNSTFIPQDIFGLNRRVTFRTTTQSFKVMDSKVEACTSENLSECDWGLIFEIVDDTNVDPTFAREIVRSLRVRLSNPNPKVVQLSLTVSFFNHLFITRVKVLCNNNNINY